MKFEYNRDRKSLLHVMGGKAKKKNMVVKESNRRKIYFRILSLHDDYCCGSFNRCKVFVVSIQGTDGKYDFVRNCDRAATDCDCCCHY